MIFIDPKTDFAFKKIFGSEQSHEILISFLNGVLYNGEPIVQDLDILNPYQAPRVRGVKASYLDVKAKLADGTSVIIEMQVLNLEGFEKRILYNAAKAYSIQLSAGEDYSQINPVIALTITDFVMFAEIDAVISRFRLKEKDFLIDYPTYDLELVFVELPKFERSLSELESLTDKWIYFLRHARSLKLVPESLAAVPEIEQAFTVANQAILTPEELDEMDHQAMFIQDQRAIITKAVKQAVKQATQQATQQGIEQGIEQGVRQTQIDIARRLLNVLEDDAICQASGLSLAEVQQLRTTPD
jgi:predicted transposase/invertase (TIGR01784 family)